MPKLSSLQYVLSFMVKSSDYIYVKTMNPVKIMWHRFSFIILFFCSSLLVFGQSMTDEQVVRFVKQEVEKGTDQQTIVTKLLQKGVSADQMRRIKKKYDAEQSQLGAVDLTGSTEVKSGSSRMRTAKEKAADEAQKRKGFMIRSQQEEKERRPISEREAELNNEVGFLDIDSLIHEFAHMVEVANPHIQDSCQKFLNKRTQNELPMSLNELWLNAPETTHELKKQFPLGPYNDNEMAKPDNFFNPYCGKFYPNGETEIFSMGVVKLVQDPINFKKEDPEYFSFIVKLMRGDI